MAISAEPLIYGMIFIAVLVIVLAAFRGGDRPYIGGLQVLVVEPPALLAQDVGARRIGLEPAGACRGQREHHLGGACGRPLLSALHVAAREQQERGV